MRALKTTLAHRAQVHHTSNRPRCSWLTPQPTPGSSHHPQANRKQKRKRKKWKNLTALSNQFPSVCIRTAQAPTWFASTLQMGGHLKWTTVTTGAQHNKDLTFSAVSWCLPDQTNLTLRNWCYKSGNVLAETTTIAHSNLWKLPNCHHSATYRSHTLGSDHMTKVSHSCIYKLPLC